MSAANNDNSELKKGFSHTKPFAASHFIYNCNKSLLFAAK